MRALKKKTTLYLTLATSLLGVLCASVSTFAWFQIDSQPLKTSITADNPGIEINQNNVYGYKIKQTLGSDGQVDYNSSTVSKFAAENIVGTNNDLDAVDRDFNVPEDGIGYYLVKFHDNGFKYDDDNSFKLIEYNTSDKSYYADVSFTSDQKVRVMKYTFDNTGGVHTVNEQVPINSVIANSSGATREESAASIYTGDVIVANAGTYRVWFDLSESSLTFETPTSTVDHRSRVRDTNNSSSIHLNNSKRTALNGDESKIYVNASNWNGKGLNRLWLYWFGNGTYSEWVSYNGWDGWDNSGNFNNDFEITVRTTYPNLIIVGDSNGNDGNYDWTFKTADLTVNDIKGKWVFPSSSSAAAPTVKLHADPGYYIIGSGGTANETTLDWSVSGALKVDGTPSGGDLAKKVGITFTLTNNNTPIEFKIVYYNAYGEIDTGHTQSDEYGYYGYGGTNDSDSATGDGQGQNVKVLKTCVLDVYVNSSGKIYVYVAVTVTLMYRFSYKTYTGTSPTTNYTSGTNYDDVKVSYNSEYTAPSSITVEGNTYTGLTWKTTSFTGSNYTNGTHIIAATTLYVTVAEKEYNINIKIAYANSSGVKQSFGNNQNYKASTRTTATTAALNAWRNALSPSTANYNFTAYYTTLTGSNTFSDSLTSISANFISSSDRTIYAVYGPKQYTVSYKKVYFNGDGTDTVSSPTSLPSLTQNPYYNESFTIKALPSESGYSVTGWFTNPECTTPYGTSPGSSTTVSADLTLYAKYTETGVDITEVRVLMNKGGTTKNTSSTLRTEQSYPTNSFSFTPTDPGTVTNYTFMGWYTAETGGSLINSWPQTYSTARTIYARYKPTEYAVKLVKKYFNYDGSASSKSDDVINNWDTAYATDATYTPGGASPSSSYEWIDAGTWTHFTCDGTYYTNEACTTPYSASAPATRTLYVKYISVGQKTFHIDTQARSWNSNIYIHGWGDGFSSGSGSHGEITASKVSNNLYKVSIPYSATGLIVDNGTYGYSQTQTTDITTINDGGLLLLKSTNTDGKVDWDWDSPKATTSVGTAYIYINNNAGTRIEMHYGDIDTYNKFVYEHGVELTAGQSVAIKVDTDNDGDIDETYSAGQYAGDIPTTYLENDGGTLKVTCDARFNFYLTTSDEISVAMVPQLGNGYYIMPYNSSRGVNNFLDGKKMNSGSKVYAAYDGYYAAEGSKIFIRSYLDAVDTLYTTLTARSNSYAEFGAGSESAVIRFKTTGYFSITVTSGTIDIQEYDTSIDFKLNPLNTSRADTINNIWAQKTSLIIEVPFTFRSNYPASVQLKATFGNLSEFMGASLYVSDTELGISCYNIVRDQVQNDVASPSATYLALSNNEIITNHSALETISTYNNVYYAYILIDYLPTASPYNGSYTNFVSAGYLSNNISFLLQAVN